MRPATGEICQNCGGVLDWTAALGQLPLSTMLRGASGHTYQIGAVRGQGGFGITYAAMDLNTGERIAIKEYYPTRCATRTQLHQVAPVTGQTDVFRGGMKSFLEEAMMLSAVGALPSVVSVKDYFEANGTAYLVMEFVDGVPLHQIVTQKGKMSAAELLPKLPELLMDLDTLHKAGIIHRDISPDNLILMPDGKLKLLDFGAARSVQDGKSMTVLLKSGFSPVEQYQSRGQGAWTDVYALAATIYYCLTGVTPPSSVDRLDEDTLQKPNALGAGLTAEQEDALLCGLIVQPKSRSASMDQFRQRLFPTPDPTPKPDDPDPAPISPPPPKRRKIGKKAILIGIAGLVALALVIWGVFYLATHGTTDDGFKYLIHQGNVYIKDYVGTESHVVIPEIIRKKPVTEISSGAFDGCETVTSVTIPRSVYWIALSAFDDCPNLQLVICNYGDLRDYYFGSSLRCVLFSDQSVYQRHIDYDRFSDMPSVVLCHVGQDTGFGQIKNAVVDEAGVVFAITNLNKAVVLGMPDGMSPDLLAGRTVNGCPIVLLDGTTEDGYEYMITADRTECWITGYSGDDTVLYLPDTVGEIAVTQIGQSAFAGNDSIISVFLPIKLEKISEKAFENCTNLKDLYLYSPITVANTSFAGCNALRCAVLEFEDASMDAHHVPDNFMIFRDGMEVGIGTLDYVGVANSGTIYGITDDDRAVVLDVPDNITQLSIAEEVYDFPVEWIYRGALDGVSPDAEIALPPNTLVDPDIWDAVNWDPGDGGYCTTKAWSWLYSCALRARINERRGTDAIVIDPALFECVQIRAKEMSTSNSHERPNGEKWSTVLDEHNVDWVYATTWKDSYNGKLWGIEEEDLEYLINLFSAPESNKDNRYYSVVAIAAYYDSSTNTSYINCIGVIR